jgi:methylenetetrahydrofolate--tRNA-(uracil-5-)-methyltransferase
VESAAIGLMAGRFAAAEVLGRDLTPPPLTTALGALLNHVTGGHIVTEEAGAPRSFQPMNVNFGLFPPITVPKPADGRRLRGADKAAEKKRALTDRARADLARWIEAQA